MQIINFFSEDIQFNLPNKKKLISWITKIIKNENFYMQSAERKAMAKREGTPYTKHNVPCALNFIFCSDTYLQKLNQKFLDHDSFTDVLTFDHAGMGDERRVSCAIEGDVFISIDRVKENARDYNNSFSNELNRVMIHGILHLIGYSDKTSKEKVLMRKKEDDCLSLLK